VARDWLTIPYVSSIFAAQAAVRVHGKFLSRDGGKFLLKAMRLPGIDGLLDLTEKLALCRRLDELAGANVNTLILSESQAETVLGVAGQAGLYAMVEIAIDPRELTSASEIHNAVARVAQTAGILRGYPALVGFLIDCPIDGSAIPSSAIEVLHKELAALARTIHENHGNQLIALKRHADAPAIATGGAEHFREISDDVSQKVAQKISSDLCTDLTYVNLARIDAADLACAIAALHRLAAAHPLVVEFGEERPGQEEMVAHAFGLGAAGVVAPAMPPAASPGWQNVRMLSAGELLPFAQVGGSSAPLPASTPMVSVVVAARDDECTIASCLESIGRLQYPNFEVIVVDDGSRDLTADIAATMGSPRLIRILREPHAGFGATCNIAMRAARGQFIAFTRADCIVDADWLALGVRAMLEGRLDGCRGPIYPSPPTEGITTRAIASLASTISVDAGEDRAVLLTDRNMIVRKASLIAVGGFDSSFIDGGGAVDLSARMIEVQMALGWCPAGCVWRCASTGVGEFYRRCIRHGRTDALLAIKHPDLFGAALRRSHQAATLDGSRPARADGTHDGIVVRSLCALFSVSGAIVQAVASRYYTNTIDRTPMTAQGSNRDDYGAARHLPIANNHARPAHPAVHR
jgi:GT2 family glycosyltransferase